MSAGSDADDSSWDEEHALLPVTSDEIKSHYQKRIGELWTDLGRAENDPQRLELLKRLFFMTAALAFVVENPALAVQAYGIDPHTRKMQISTAPHNVSFRDMMRRSAFFWDGERAGRK